MWLTYLFLERNVIVSDSFNDEIAKVEDFNAVNYVRSLCKNKKIQIDDYADIHFFSRMERHRRRPN